MLKYYCAQSVFNTVDTFVDWSRTRPSFRPTLTTLWFPGWGQWRTTLPWVAGTSSTRSKASSSRESTTLSPASTPQSCWGLEPGGPVTCFLHATYSSEKQTVGLLFHWAAECSVCPQLYASCTDRDLCTDLSVSNTLLFIWISPLSPWLDWVV